MQRNVTSEDLAALLAQAGVIDGADPDGRIVIDLRPGQAPVVRAEPHDAVTVDLVTADGKVVGHRTTTWPPGLETKSAASDASSPQG